SSAAAIINPSRQPGAWNTHPIPKASAISRPLESVMASRRCLGFLSHSLIMKVPPVVSSIYLVRAADRPPAFLIRRTGQSALTTRWDADTLDADAAARALFTSSSAATACGSRCTSMRPVLKYTLASPTAGSAFNAFSLFATQDGHESPWLRKMVFISDL